MLAEPLSFKECLKMQAWMFVPIVGFVFAIMWAVGNDEINPNKRNYWRAYWIYAGIMYAIVMVMYILIILLTVMIGFFAAMMMS